MRVFVIVLDSLGVGALPDADQFGDAGAHTLDHLVAAVVERGGKGGVGREGKAVEGQRRGVEEGKKGEGGVVGHGGGWGADLAGRPHEKQKGQGGTKLTNNN